METAGNGQNLCQGSSEGRCVVCAICNIVWDSVCNMQYSVGYMQYAIYCNIASLLCFAHCSLAAQLKKGVFDKDHVSRPALVLSGIGLV